jgi:hypothetical protein
VSDYGFNPFIGTLDEVGGGSSVLSQASDPLTSIDGQFLINTTEENLKIWYGGQWNLVATFTIIRDSLLLESDDYLLQENGDRLRLEV